MNDFEIFYSLDVFQINSYVPMIYYELYYSKKSYNFNTNLNYHFKTWKTKHVLHLLRLLYISVTTPNIFILNVFLTLRILNFENVSLTKVIHFCVI